MAEALGIAASIIAVLQLTGKLTSVGYGYIGGVRRAAKDLGELLQGLGSLSGVLLSLQHYVDANPGSAALQRLDDPNGPLRMCAKELEELISKLTPRDGWKGKIDGLKWPLKEKEISQYVLRIERHKSLFVFALTADQISLSKEIEKHVQATRVNVEDIKEEVQEIRGDLGVETAAQDAWRRKEGDLRVVTKRTEALKWLCPDNVDKKHIEISKMRQKGTGQWLLERKEFREWSTNKSDIRLLWGCGIPGAGKTVLSSKVIDHFESHTEYGVAHIYFDYKEQDQQTPAYVLASLVKQLARQIPQLPAAIDALYDKIVGEDRRPTPSELYATLLVVARLFPRVFIILDALDECHPESQRKELLPLFHCMGRDGMNLFLTSRPHSEDIQVSLGGFTVKVELSASEEDLASYIEGKINEHPRAKRLVQLSKCKERIISDLVNCAKGMFLLVRFHIEYLCQQATAKQILTGLDKLKLSATGEMSLPLDPTYDRAMENLYGQPKSCVELALKVLAWLVKARRTLTLEEIQAAVSVEPNRYELDELDLPDRTTLLDVCASLVIIDEDTNTIRLAHYTVQEYLVKKNVPEDADLYLAMVCTTYLSFDAFKSGACRYYQDFKDRLDSHPLLPYAASQLDFHLKECAEDISTDMVLKFLSSFGSISTYLQICDTEQKGVVKYWRNPSYYRKNYQQFPLNLASALGHSAVVRKLLEEGQADQSIPDCNGKTALHHAVSGGHKGVVQVLLEKGASISAWNNGGRTLLHWAAFWGYKELICLLIEKGAYHWSVDCDGKTALHYAAYRGHKEVVQVLLEKGAVISALDNELKTVLHWAASQGHKEAICLLIQKGAYDLISFKDRRGRTALDYAVLLGHTNVIQTLLEHHW